MYFLANFVLWYFWIFVCLFVHEFGHAIAARLVRLKILAVVIGYGKALFAFEVFGIPVEVNAKPFNGMTYAFPTDYAWVKTRMWLYNAGGLFTHIVFIAAFMLFGFKGMGAFFTSVLETFAPFETFFLANLFLFAINAFPYKIKMPQGLHTSDGYKFFQIPFQKMEEIFALEKIQARLEAWNHQRKGDTEKAVEIYERLLAENPDDAILKHDLAIAKLRFGNYEEARELLTASLGNEEFALPPMKMLLYNNIAWIDAVLGRDDLLKEADAFSLEAYRSNPRFINFIGTRGSVLVRLGKNQHGLGFLMQAYGKTTDRRGRSENACFIAIGHAQTGNFKEAAAWLEKARKNDTDHKLIEIAGQEIDALRAARQGNFQEAAASTELKTFV